MSLPNQRVAKPWPFCVSEVQARSLQLDLPRGGPSIENQASGAGSVAANLQCHTARLPRPAPHQVQ